MQTLTDKTKNGLIKKFHTLIGKVGGGNERKEAILWRCGVEHANELSIDQLIDECEALDRELKPKLDELVTWRNRLIAAISAYHQANGEVIFQKKYEDCTPPERERRINYAKGTAENAAGKQEFNKIPLEQLRQLYNGFIRAKKDVVAVNTIMQSDLLHNISLN